jgi:hypothetical protein
MRGCERSAAFVRYLLSHRRNGVHVTQAIGQNFHHVRRKMRCLLNEEVKPTSVDLCQLGRTLRHSVCRSGTVINERHLAKERARACGFKYKVTEKDVHFTFQ